MAEAIGQRVAHHRRRKGLTQHELSKLLGRAPGWAGAVERGEYRLERLDMIAKVAVALDVTVAQLCPDVITATAGGSEPQSDPTGLVALISSYPSLRPGPTPAPVDRGTLQMRVTHMRELAHTGSYDRLAAELVETLPLVDQGGEADPAGDLLASKVYGLAATALTAVGEHAGAWVAADRSIRAAGTTTQAFRAVLRAARLFAAADRWIQAGAGAQSVLDALTPTIDAGGSEADPAELAMAGIAHLILAERAAHQVNRGRADHHLDRADTLATRLGPSQNCSAIHFDPLVVECHRVTVAVTLQDAGDALQIAERIDTSRLPPGRHAQLCLDMARAEILRRAPQRAMNLLHQALALDPPLIAHNPKAWAAIDDLSGLFSRTGTRLDQLRALTRSRP